MATFTPSGWTPTAEQVKDLSMAIVQEVFLNSDINEFHEIQTGISHDMQILLMDSYAVVGKAITGCSPSEVGDFTLTEKQWTPKLIGGKKTYCATNENQNLAFLKQAKNVMSDYFQRNPDSSELNVVFSILAMAIYNSILPKAWFSDTTADLHTGTGVFSTGTDLGLFNQFDGLWKQIFSLGASYKYTITKNAGASYSAQALADGEGLTIVQNLYKGASTFLKANANGIILVSQSIYTQLQIDLANKGLDNGGVIETFVNGVPQVKAFGVPVKAVPAWDITVASYQNNGTKWNLPHRGVYTTKQNIPIGTLSKDDLANLTYKYNDYENENKLEFAYFLDAKLLTSNLVYAAY